MNDFSLVAKPTYFFLTEKESQDLAVSFRYSKIKLLLLA